MAFFKDGFKNCPDGECREFRFYVFQLIGFARIMNDVQLLVSSNPYNDGNLTAVNISLYENIISQQFIRLATSSSTPLRTTQQAVSHGHRQSL